MGIFGVLIIRHLWQRGVGGVLTEHSFCLCKEFFVSTNKCGKANRIRHLFGRGYIFLQIIIFEYSFESVLFKDRLSYAFFIIND